MSADPPPPQPQSQPQPFAGKRLRVASLFSGAGGMDLGLHRAGHDIVLQCECDPGAQQVCWRKGGEGRRRQARAKHKA